MLICHLDAVTLRHIASIYIRSHTNVDTCTVACTAYVYSYKIGLQTFTDLGTKTQDVRSHAQHHCSSPAGRILMESGSNLLSGLLKSLQDVAAWCAGYNQHFETLAVACATYIVPLKIAKSNKNRPADRSMPICSKICKGEQKADGGEAVLLRCLGNSDSTYLKIIILDLCRQSC